MQDLNAVRSSVEKQLNDKAAAEAARASASLSAADARILCLQEELQAVSAAASSEAQELSSLHLQLQQQKQLASKASAAAAAEAATAACTVGKLTDERNTLQGQQQLLQQQYEQLVQQLQVERDQREEQTLVISRLQMELSVATTEVAQLRETRVRNPRLMTFALHCTTACRRKISCSCLAMLLLLLMPPK